MNLESGHHIVTRDGLAEQVAVPPDPRDPQIAELERRLRNAEARGISAVGCERARPARKDGSVPAAAPRETLDLVVALDLSMSMLENDHPHDRLETATYALRKFVARIHEIRIGLVISGQQALVVLPSTSELKQARHGDGLAFDQLGPPTAKHRVVLLLADGDSNVVNRYDPVQAAASRKQPAFTSTRS